MLDAKQMSNRYEVVIAAQMIAYTSPAYELMAEGEYTLSCSTLDVGEVISVEIYDHTQNIWQPFMLDGKQFRLIKGYENIPISNFSCVVRFIKTETANDVGLVIGYRGKRYTSIKPIAEVSHGT